MKNFTNFIIPLLLIVFWNPVHAQKLHFKTGPSFSAVKTDLNGNESMTGYLTSFAFHAGIDYLKKGSFNLSSEIGWVRKGLREQIYIMDNDGNLTGESFELKLHRDYLHLNTLANYHIPLADKLSIFANAGPYVGISLAGDDCINDTTLFGLVTGAGFKYDLANYQLGVVFDYYLDFNHLTDTDFELPIVNTSSTSRYHLVKDYKAFALQLYFAIDL